MPSLPDVQAPDRTASLMALVRDFDRDAPLCRRKIVDLLGLYPEAFYTSTIEVLAADTESRAAQFLISLLVSRNLLFRALSDPELDGERALVLARFAIRMDPMVDTALARQFADASTSPSSGGGMGMPERLLEILNKISDGRRILPSLIRILRNNNPYLRSKAVLMVGKGGHSIGWIKRRLEEPDTRVRANAMEALWGIEGEEARELLEAGARDGNNRVAGNALLGLYLLGETAALPEIVKMAGHVSGAFRRTAAWIMGQSGDPRFSEVVGRMLADPHNGVRKVAFEAVRQIRGSVAQISQAAEWLVSGCSFPKDPRSGHRRVSIAVTPSDAGECPRIAPVQFHLSEGGQTVWSYRVLDRPAPDALTVLFLFPRTMDNGESPWARGANRCIVWKRSTDLWCFVPYALGEGAKTALDLELPSFISSKAQAAQAFQQPPSRGDCTSFWTTIQRAAQAGGPARSNRQLVVFAAETIGEPPDPAPLAAIHASRSGIHIVSTRPNPVLEEFCRRTGGDFRQIDDARVEEGIALAYLNLLARYEIRYQSLSPDADALKLRVHTPAGWGETEAPLSG